MAFDLKTALASVAPTLATMLGGPLAGTAVAALAQCFGLSAGATEADLVKVVQSGGMTPEVIAQMRVADQHHAEVMGQQGIDLAKINADHEAATFATEVDDRKDARAKLASTDHLWVIAWFVLATFAVMMGLVLWGCYNILQGGITIKDVAVVAAISGLVGSIVGYVAANAQTVINFLYGGSLGSRRNADAMAASAQQAISAITK